jgi:group I intron endonuclease
MICIYKITSPVGLVYIGQTKNYKQRMCTHKNMWNKKECAPKLYDSFIKYGVENHSFEVLEECTLDSLNERERYYQELYIDISLNIVLTKTKHKKGIGAKITEERKKQIGDLHRGKIYNEETRNKIKAARARQVITEEHKKKISENSGNAKYVLNLETGIYFKSAKEAANAHNIKHNTLIGALIGRSSKIKNFIYA